VDVIPSTGLLIKYDPTIPLIYFGFGLLIITTFLSFFPYTQIWIFEEASFLRGKRKISRKQNKIIWFGGSTNRGQIQFEIEFENLIRFPDYFFQKTLFLDSSF
jgi:cytochrome c biogenesis protein